MFAVSESEMTGGRAGYALSAIGTPAVQPVASKLTRDNPSTRIAAVTILGDIDLLAVPALIDALPDPHTLVRLGRNPRPCRLGPLATDALEASEQVLAGVRSRLQKTPIDGPWYYTQVTEKTNKYRVDKE